MADSDKVTAHINGWYVMAAAIVGGLFTLGGVYLTAHGPAEKPPHDVVADKLPAAAPVPAAVPAVTLPAAPAEIPDKEVQYEYSFIKDISNTAEHEVKRTNDAKGTPLREKNVFRIGISHVGTKPVEFNEIAFRVDSVELKTLDGKVPIIKNHGMNDETIYVLNPEPGKVYSTRFKAELTPDTSLVPTEVSLSFGSQTDWQAAKIRGRFRFGDAKIGFYSKPVDVLLLHGTNSLDDAPKAPGEYDPSPPPKQ